MPDITDPIKKAVLDALKEYSAAMAQVATHKEHAKNILSAIHDVSGLEKKYIGKIARYYHQQSLAQSATEFEEVRELYEKIVGAVSVT